MISPAVKVIAPGLMVMVVIYFMGSVSEAHLNPGYLLAQAVGAIAAVFFLCELFGTVAALGATVPQYGGSRSVRRGD